MCAGINGMILCVGHFAVLRRGALVRIGSARDPVHSRCIVDVILSRALPAEYHCPQFFELELEVDVDVLLLNVCRLKECDTFFQ